MGTSKITWTKVTWNPVVGCTVASPGCKNCYAAGMATRQVGMSNKKKEAGQDPGRHADYDGTVEGGKWTGLVRTLPDRLSEPLKWRTPTKIFVVSMGDLFHEDVPDEFILKVFRTMHEADWHTYQLLTKRPDRILEVERHPEFPGWASHIQVGVTVESPAYFWRADRLRQCRAHVRFVSAEPLLASIADIDLTDIDWLIVGGESGARARLLEESWVDEAIAAADESGTPIHVKQLGTAWARAHGFAGKADKPEEWPERFRRRDDELPGTGSRQRGGEERPVEPPEPSTAATKLSVRRTTGARTLGSDALVLGAVVAPHIVGWGSRFVLATLDDDQGAIGALKKEIQEVAALP